jgi:hypothetical protein
VPIATSRRGEYCRTHKLAGVPPVGGDVSCRKLQASPSSTSAALGSGIHKRHYVMLVPTVAETGSGHDPREPNSDTFYQVLGHFLSEVDREHSDRFE